MTTQIDWLKKHQDALETIRAEIHNLTQTARIMGAAGNEKIANELFDAASNLQTAEQDAGDAIGQMLTEAIGAQRQTMGEMFVVALKGITK